MTDQTELFPVTDRDLAGLRARLALAADADGVLDITYRILDTPVGPLLLAATDRGLVRVAFESEGFDAVVDSIAAAVGPNVLASGRRLDDVARQLDDYFARRRRAFDVPLDFRLSAGFRQTVQQYLPHIEYGHTLSYKQVAESVGNPNAVRAVGSACATNPLPVVVPCHRVRKSDGSLGGYLGGLEAKAALLELEGAA